MKRNIKVTSYLQDVQINSYTEHTGASFRIARGISIGKGYSQRRTQEKVKYIKHTEDAELIIKDNAIKVAGIEYFFDIYDKSYDHFSKLKFLPFSNNFYVKDGDMIYYIKGSKNITDEIIDAICELEESGDYFEQLSFCRTDWYVVLGLVPVLNILWFNRLISNGWRFWLCIFLIPLISLSVLSKFFPNLPVLQILIVAPWLEAFFVSKKIKDASGYTEM